VLAVCCSASSVLQCWQCVAMCCVLQCVAMCCNMLQRVAVLGSVLLPGYNCPYQAVMCVTVRYSVLQCIATRRLFLSHCCVCCSVLQCVAVCCSVLQCVVVLITLLGVLQCVVCTTVRVLQCVAICCSVFQCVAARPSSSQYPHICFHIKIMCVLQ